MATDHIVGRVSSIVALCTRHVSRATRRLLRHRLRYGVGGRAGGAPRSRRKEKKKQQEEQTAVPVPAPAVHEQTAVPVPVPVPAPAVHEQTETGEVEQEEDGDGDGEGIIWRRAILMGGRCQPLDFVGAIHYDSFGRRLARPPTPRSASSLSCRSSDSLATYLETTEV